MRINHNIPSLVAKNAISRANDSTDNSAKKLSTGKRVNTAADDAAGLAIINKFKTQVKGLNMADRNASDAISLIQTAEGGLSEMHNMLQRMRELAVQGANDTLTTSDRLKIQSEVDQLSDEMDKTAGKIQFNTKPLLNQGSTFTFQVGANKENGTNGMELKVTMVNVSAASIGIASLTTSYGVSHGNVVPFGTGQPCGVYSSRAGCASAINTLDAAISTISDFRSKLGAIQNRLDYTVAAVRSSVENAVTALSRVEDTDMAEAMTEYSTTNVLVQAGISMLAQSNQRPQQVLQLLQ